MSFATTPAPAADRGLEVGLAIGVLQPAAVFGHDAAAAGPQALAPGDLSVPTPFAGINQVGGPCSVQRLPGSRLGNTVLERLERRGSGVEIRAEAQLVPRRNGVLPVEVQAVTAVARLLVGGVVDQRSHVRAEERLLLQGPVLPVVHVAQEIAAPDPPIVVEVAAGIQAESHRLGEPAAATTLTATAPTPRERGSAILPRKPLLVHVVRVRGEGQLHGRREAVQVEPAVVAKVVAGGGDETALVVHVAPEASGGSPEVAHSGLLAELQVDRALIVAIGYPGELRHVRLLVVDVDLLHGVGRQVACCDRGVPAEELLPLHEHVLDLFALRGNRAVGVDIDPGQAAQQVLDHRVRRGREGVDVVAERVPPVDEGDVLDAHDQGIDLRSPPWSWSPAPRPRRHR